MALPIQPTPVLEGEDAERFIYLFEHPEKMPPVPYIDGNKVRARIIEEKKNNYKRKK